MTGLQSMNKLISTCTKNLQQQSMFNISFLLFLFQLFYICPTGAFCLWNVIFTVFINV